MIINIFSTEVCYMLGEKRRVEVGHKDVQMNREIRDLRSEDVGKSCSLWMTVQRNFHLWDAEFFYEGNDNDVIRYGTWGVKHHTI